MALTVGSGSVQFAQQVTLDPANITTATVSEQSFTIVGIRTDVMYKVDAPSLNTGVYIVGSIPTAKDTLKISFWNSTGSDVNPASQSFRIIGF